MKAPVFLGIDAGTTNIKAALIDADGNTIDLVKTATEVISPFEGSCEMDMDALWGKLCSITKSLRDRNPDIWYKVEGIGITGQGDGLWPIDKEGKPVRNAVLWNDTRVKHLELPNREEIEKLCIENHAAPLFAGSAPLILKWIEQEERDNYNRIYKALHCKDWLNFKLTGQIVTDYTDASTSLMDIFRKSYVWEIGKLMELTNIQDLLPNAVESAYVIGKVSRQGSKESGINEGTPVIAGALDVAAVALGAGVVSVGEACTILGTTLCNEVMLDKSKADNTYTNGSVLCHILPDSYIRVMAALSGTSALDWVRNILSPATSFEEIERAIKDIPVGSKGIIYHPYIYGERAPFKDPFACGGFYGLNARHNKFDMIRAAYEGIAMSMYDCYKSLPEISGKIYISGGGSESSFLCQILADCLGKQILRPSVKELGIQGIVYTLKFALGYDKDFLNIKGRREDIFQPNVNNHRKYIELYNMYKELKNSMEIYWKNRAKFAVWSQQL